MIRADSRPARRGRRQAGVAAPLLQRHTAVRIGSADMPGELDTVPDMVGLVLFAHGGKSRNYVRSRHVAREPRCHRMGTLLFDLLTESEAQVPFQRPELDVELLAQRVVQALDWVARSATLARHACSLFGTSIGAAAALLAAAQRPALVSALV
jgi:putative phosphoribosyl transferase